MLLKSPSYVMQKASGLVKVAITINCGTLQFIFHTQAVLYGIQELTK